MPKGSPPPKPSPHIHKLVPYQPGKPIAEVKRELGLTDVVKLASNENALGPSPKALSAIAEAAAQVHLYPEGACHGLRNALSGFLGVPPDWLVFGNGSDELIHFLGLTYLQEGHEVLIAEPTFVRYEAAAALNRATCVRVPLADWAYDVNAICKAVSPQTRLIFLANPNNPTGTYMSEDGFAKLVQVLPPDCILCVDEAYYEYVDAADYPDSLEYVRAGYNVAVLRTFSKIYGLAGLRIGYGVARPEIVSALEQVREPFNVNSLAQAAAGAALQDNEHRERSREMVIAGRVWLTEQLAALGLRPYPSQANFVWVETLRDARLLFEELLRKGVIVRTGDIFGAPTCLRITIGTMHENRRLVQALKEVLYP